MEDRETPRMRKYGESKTTRIMMATVRHVTSSSGLRKFQADGFLLHLSVPAGFNTFIYKKSVCSVNDVPPHQIWHVELQMFSNMAVIPQAKDNFRTAAILLFHTVPKKKTLTKASTFATAITAHHSANMTSEM